MQQPAGPNPEERTSPEAADKLGALDEETVELCVVARALGLGAQGLWSLIEQQGLQVLRLHRAGRTWSALTRVDHDRLVAQAGGAPAPREPESDPQRDVLDPLMDRVRAAEDRSQSLEGRLLEMRTRAAQSGLQMREARRQMAELRNRFESELAAAQRQLMERARRLERAGGREQSLARELDRARQEHTAQLAELAAQKERLRRQLELATELERANDVYLDRLERAVRRSG